MTSTYKTILLTPVILILFTACSVKYSFTGASIPIEAKTFSVARIPNMALNVNPLLSNKIEEGLKAKFMQQTSLDFRQSDGDLSFTGTVISYQLAPMAIQAGSDQAAQTRLTISVKIEFKNIYDEKTNFDTQFTQYVDFDSSLDFDAIEQQQTDIIVEKIIEDIFNRAVVNW